MERIALITFFIIFIAFLLMAVFRTREWFNFQGKLYGLVPGPEEPTTMIWVVRLGGIVMIILILGVLWAVLFGTPTTAK